MTHHPDYFNQSPSPFSTGWEVMKFGQMAKAIDRGVADNNIKSGMDHMGKLEI
jgi:hypothetical protein